MKYRQGFTLIEVMVSTAVLGVIMFYLMEMLVQSSRAYEVVDDVNEAQQNLRAISDLVEREVRSTGMLVREGGAICGIDNDVNGSDILFLTDSDAIDPEDVSESSLGFDVWTGYSGAGTDTITIIGRALEPDPTDLMYDNSTPLNGTADSDFFWPGAGIGGGLILTDKHNPSRGTQCGIVTQVEMEGASDLKVDVDWDITIGGTQYAPGNPGLGPLPLGASTPDLIAIPAHVYLIDRSGIGPRLWRDGMVLADDVEDLQVAYFHDADADGVIDPLEWSGDTVGTPYAANALDNTFLLAVRFNLVVRTANEDADVVQDPLLAFGVVQAIENSAVPVGPADGYRRRVHTRTVRPRNVGLRGVAAPTSL